MNLSTFFKKVINKVVFIITSLYKRRRHSSQESRTLHAFIQFVPSNIALQPISKFLLTPTLTNYLADMYLSHRFDLLGSGWVKNSYTDNALGVEGYRYTPSVVIANADHQGDWLSKVVLPVHFPISKQIWQQTSKNYSPVDWQKDYKSGYRWNAKKWYKDQRIAPLPGVDIKVPWEIARFQHLPQMAICASQLPSKRNQLILEFRDQVLDFIATNPPNMGVNWTCTMDVGIRAANILVAYDLFLQLDEQNHLTKSFQEILADSMYRHGKHIVSNLEWFPTLTTNHYLSNIAGLLFIAAYLESTLETTTWLAFGIQELINECRKQFYPDGSNFEASTCYHRLSGELIVYSSALLLGLPSNKLASLTHYKAQEWHYQPSLRSYSEQEYKIKNDQLIMPEWFTEYLFKAGLFTLNLTKKTGEVAQIGDNDSGRFFRFSPAGQFISNQVAVGKYLNLQGYDRFYNSNELFWDENSLDHRTFVSALAGLFNESLFNSAAELYPLEKSIVTSLAKGAKLSYKSAIKTSIPIQQLSKDYLNYPSQINTFHPSLISDIPLNQNLYLRVYPDTGICLLQSDRLHLTISAGPNGQNNWGGHAHNDKLSFELNIDGQDIVRDPGTYLYTALPAQRNAFRSAQAHFTMLKDEEQNRWVPGQRGLFFLNQETTCKFIEAGENYVGFSLQYRNVHQVRFFYVTKYALEVKDFCNIVPCFTKQPQFLFYSNGYGKLTTAATILL